MTLAFQPEKFSLKYLPLGSLCHVLGWTNDAAGNVTPVVRAQFDLGDGQLVEAFAKLFDPEAKDKVQATSTLNEITAWLLGSAMGLPMPPTAFITFIEPAALPLPPASVINNLPRPAENGAYWAFCTQSVGDTAVKGHYNTDLLVKEQADWQRCDETIAFDEALGNTDRHLGNLLRQPNGSFVLIDHGYLLRDADLVFPKHWRPDWLSSSVSTQFENLLHKHAYFCAYGLSKPKCAAGLEKAEGFAVVMHAKLREAFFEIAFWCQVLLPGKSAEWLHFLYSRFNVTNLNQLLQHRYGILF